MAEQQHLEWYQSSKNELPFAVGERIHLADDNTLRAIGDPDGDCIIVACDYASWDGRPYVRVKITKYDPDSV